MTDELVSWQEIEQEFGNKETSLLLGKNFSCAVWNRFKDSSLYEEAKNTPETCLSKKHIEIFEKLKTDNFEKVLAALSTAKEINEILEGQTSQIVLQINEYYHNIQDTLIEVVKRVHIHYNNFQQQNNVVNKKITLKKDRKDKNVSTIIREELLKYQNLFYTSYDLLIYWSLMQGDIEFGDYFNNETFDKEISIPDGWLRIFYLHGSLHLYSKEEEIKKIKNKGINKDILTLCEEFWKNPENRPLFMVEGTSKEKLEFIRNSDYLFFAYEQLKQNTDKLVILGNPLNLDKNLLDKNPHFNQHLLDVIVKQNHPKVAISLTEDEGDISQQIEYWKLVMKRKDIKFFKEKSHPLCSPGMRIQQSEN